MVILILILVFGVGCNLRDPNISYNPDGQVADLPDARNPRNDTTPDLRKEIDLTSDAGILSKIDIGDMGNMNRVYDFAFLQANLWNF